MTRRLQSRTAMATVLGTLFQTEVSTHRTDVIRSLPGAICIYRHTDGSLSGAMWVDQGFAMAATCALCLMTPDHAAEAALEGPHLPERWHVHFHEVANICSRFFGAPEAPRVVLDALWISPTDPPSSVMDEMCDEHDIVEHRIVTMNLGDFGEGVMHLVAFS